MIVQDSSRTKMTPQWAANRCVTYNFSSSRFALRSNILTLSRLLILPLSLKYILSSPAVREPSLQAALSWWGGGRGKKNQQMHDHHHDRHHHDRQHHYHQHHYHHHHNPSPIIMTTIIVTSVRVLEGQSERVEVWLNLATRPCLWRNRGLSVVSLLLSAMVFFQSPWWFDNYIIYEENVLSPYWWSIRGACVDTSIYQGWRLQTVQGWPTAWCSVIGRSWTFTTNN